MPTQMSKNVIGKTIGTVGARWRDEIARIIIEKEISPNVLTFIGVSVNIIGGVILALGVYGQPGRYNWILALAGCVIFLANVFDMLDGAVARLSGNTTKFGAFIDSVMDRYSDMAMLGGALFYFAYRQDTVFAVMTVLAFVGSIMTSYTRSRAESVLPGKFNSGYMERPERVIVIGVTCLLNRLYVGIIFVAILSNLATFHRIWDAWRMDHNMEHPESARQSYGSLNSPLPLRFLRNLLFWPYPRESLQYTVLCAALFMIAVLLTVFTPGR